MSLYSAVTLANWVATPSIQLVIVVSMWRRRLLGRLPWFFVYTVWVMASSLALLPLYLRMRADLNNMPAYYYAGWTADAVSVALGFAVVYEVFSQLFHPYQAFRRLAPALFRWCGVALLLLGSVAALGSSPGRMFNLTAGFLILERTLRLVQVGLLLLALVACRYLGISWRREVLGIALGFGMYAAISMVCSTLQAQNGLVAYYQLGLVAALAYTCAVMIWAAYFLQPEAAAGTAALVPKSTNVEQWNQALSHLLQQ